jgi:hypothetical protein
MFSVRFKLVLKAVYSGYSPLFGNGEWGMALEWTGHVTVMEEATSVGKIIRQNLLESFHMAVS